MKTFCVITKYYTSLMNSDSIESAISDFKELFTDKIIGVIEYNKISKIKKKLEFL